MANKEYTEEELNYFRVCYITTHIIREGLRELFKREWDCHHSGRFGAWQDTAGNGQDFFRMESRKSRSKNSRLLGTIQSGNTEEWDCTCFFFAILYSDSLSRSISPTVANSVDDLRVFRNGVFAHLSKGSILQTDFQRCVSKVSGAFTSLHLGTTELQRIINQKSFPTGELQMLQKQVSVLEDEIKGKPKSFMVLPQPPSHQVVERKMEVDNIMQKFTDLQNTNKDASIVTVYVSGNPGCGKSQIAREVGKQFFEREAAKDDHDSCTLVMTLNAESEQSLLDSYYKFARKVGVTEYSLNSITGGDSKLLPCEKVSHLKTLVSAKMQNYSNWLLIFDNVNELESMRGCFPDEDWVAWPDEYWGGGGHVLVTTQDGSNLPVADSLCENVSLSEGMRPEDARSLLQSICLFSCDEEEETLVLDALDYQPLAIACAALYVQYIDVGRRLNPGNIWKNYLEKLETLEKRISTEKVYKRTSKSYRSSMTSAVTLALEKLVQEPMFEPVVQFLALGAPAPVDLDLIVSFVKKQDPDCDEDMTAAEISKCSLLMQLSPDDSSRMQVKMHQVVHAVFHKYIHDKYSKEQIAGLILLYIETLSTSAQHDPLHFDLEFHISSRMMVPHLNSLRWSVKKEIVADLVMDTTRDTSRRNELQRTFFNFGDICRKHCFLIEARGYFSYALQIAKNDFDGNDPNKLNFIATILNNEGLVFHENGQLEVAESYHMRALDILQKLHPPNANSPEIADSLNKLGNVYYNYGCMEKARDFFQKSLHMREQLRGHQHAEVAASLSNLGSVHSVMGDLETAGDFFQRSHALRKEIYGEVHPCVADSLNNLGILYSEIGLTEKAIQYQEQALEMRKKLFFQDHVLISDSYNNLALAYQYDGQLLQAKECFDAALHIREKYQANEIMSGKGYLGLLINCSVLYRKLGEMEKAKDLYDHAQKMMTSFYGASRLQERFIANDEPGQHFKSFMYSRYGYAVAQGNYGHFDPLPPEQFPITFTPESPRFQIL